MNKAEFGERNFTKTIDDAKCVYGEIHYHCDVEF